PPIARVRAEQYRVPSDVEGPQLRQGNIAAGGVVAPYLDDQYDRRHHQRQDGDTNSDRREATTGRRADWRLQARVDARRRSISRRKRSMARARFPSHRRAEPARISSEHRPSGPNSAHGLDARHTAAGWKDVRPDPGVRRRRAVIDP